MKRTILLMALAWMCLPGHGRAQGPCAAFGASFVRVGAIDLAPLYENNEKFKTLKTKLATELAPFEKKRDEYKKLVNDWAAALRTCKMTDAERENGARVIVECRRRLEDLEMECAKTLKKNDAVAREMKLVDAEVAARLRDHATDHGYHVVVGSRDANDLFILLPDDLRRYRNFFRAQLPLPDIDGAAGKDQPALIFLDFHFWH